MKALEAGNVKILTEATVKEILDDGVVVVKGGEEEFIKADAIVLAVGSEPENKLASIIENKQIKVIRIGDAVKVRKVLDAVAEGYEAGMKI